MPLPDKSHLAKPSKRREDGYMPDAKPRFGPLLVAKWAAEKEPVGLAKAGARFRHSDAGACSRAVAYAALGLSRKAFDAPSEYIARQGTIIHEAIQEAMSDFEYEGVVEHEVKVSLLDGDTAGHSDTHIEGDVSVTIEYKSVDGYKYKKAIGDRGPAAGPSYTHMIQAALNGRAKDADEVTVVYLSRGALSVQASQKAGIDVEDPLRVTAEWTMSREVYEPMADKELERVKAILALLDDGVLPARKIPDPEMPKGHYIVDPMKGAYVATEDGSPDGKIVDTGSAWQCLYCDFQEICAKTPPTRTPIAEVPVLQELLK